MASLAMCWTAQADVFVLPITLYCSEFADFSNDLFVGLVDAVTMLTGARAIVSMP